jgi:predicted nucleic acid-binding protein
MRTPLAGSPVSAGARIAEWADVAVLADTTVLIDVLRGRTAGARILALQRTGETPYVCAVNVEELARGVRSRERLALGRLLNGLRLAPLGRREGELAGEWRRAFAKQGTTLSQADCLIAAAAVGAGAILVTGNTRHFPMPGLTVEQWPVGE